MKVPKLCNFSSFNDVPVLCFSILAHGTLKKLYNLLTNPSLSTISQIQSQIPEIVNPLYSLHIKISG